MPLEDLHCFQVMLFSPQRDGMVSGLSQVLAPSLGDVFISRVTASDLPRGPLRTCCPPAPLLPSCAPSCWPRRGRAGLCRATWDTAAVHTAWTEQPELWRMRPSSETEASSVNDQC